MRSTIALAAHLAASLRATPAAHAALVRVTLTGEVDFNHMQFISGPPVGDGGSPCR